MVKRLGMLLCAAVAAAGLGGVAHAVPITYEGLLVAFETRTDSIPTTGNFDSPSSDVSDYWGFIPQESAPRWDIAAFRLEAAFDPALWVFEGFFDDTTDFAGGFSSEIDEGDPGFLAFADDELAPSLPGPFGDPRARVDLQAGTFYTFIVTNFASGDDDGDGVFPYRIRVVPIPVPAALPLLVTAFGLMGYLGYWRRAV
jgi:hypothetical protein